LLVAGGSKEDFVIKFAEIKSLLDNPIIEGYGDIKGNLLEQLQAIQLAMISLGDN